MVRHRCARQPVPACGTPDGGGLLENTPGGGICRGAQFPPPVPGAGGMGQAPSHEIMRDTGPIIGTPPDEAAAIPLGSYPGAKPRHWDGDREPGSAEKTGTVHTRTQSFDAGEMGAPPTCAAARSLALRLPWFSRPLWLRGSLALTRCARVSQPRRTSLRG